MKSGEEEIMMGVSPSENGSKFVILPAKQKSNNNGIKDNDDNQVAYISPTIIVEQKFLKIFNVFLQNKTLFRTYKMSRLTNVFFG